MRARLVLICCSFVLAACGSDRRGLDRGPRSPTGDEGTNNRPGETLECSESSLRACDCGADHVGVQTCVEGRWGPCGVCVDPSNAACREGERVSCVCSETESGDRACVDGFFGACDCGSSNSTCPEGETRGCDCEAGHGGVQTCEDGRWTSCRQCVDPSGECGQGETQACACEGGGEGERACEEGSWGRCMCESTGGGCEVHPDCRRYADKLRTCYPDWNADHYAACDDMFDICDLGDGCNAHYPAHVRCVLSTSCEAILDDACHPVTCG